MPALVELADLCAFGEKGARAVFHDIEVRHLHAAIVLAEELTSLERLSDCTSASLHSVSKSLNSKKRTGFSSSLAIHDGPQKSQTLAVPSSKRRGWLSCMLSELFI
jgi:hypothetical protein